eukprot:1137280-Pelagomonas_calceolata.AAC.2
MESLSSHQIRILLKKLPEDVLTCATYLKPQSSSRPAQEIGNLFYTLGEEILLAKTVTPHVAICGDFNAHIGGLNEITDAHYDLHATYPQLTGNISTQCPHINRAGKCLVDVAPNLNCIITTGRAPGDWGQPSFIGYNKRRRSRPDHLTVSKCLYSFIGQVTPTEPTCLDHCFHMIAFSIPDTHITHIDKRLHSFDSETLQDSPERYLIRWRADKALAYAAHMYTLKGIEAPGCWYDCLQTSGSANGALGKPDTLVGNCTESIELKRSVLSDDTPALELQNSCTRKEKKKKTTQEVNTPHINQGKGATLVHRPYDHPATKFRLREVRQAEKYRSSNEKESNMIAERLEFQTFNNKQNRRCQSSNWNQGKPCPAAVC